MQKQPCFHRSFCSTESCDGKVQGTSRCDGGWPGAHGWSMRGQQKQHETTCLVQTRDPCMGSIWKYIFKIHLLGSQDKREKLWSVYAVFFFISRAALTSKDLVRYVLDLVSLTCKCHVTVCSETNERPQLSKRKRLPRWDVFTSGYVFCFTFVFTFWRHVRRMLLQGDDWIHVLANIAKSAGVLRSTNFSRRVDSTVPWMFKQ